jgi:hypothetical protein
MKRIRAELEHLPHEHSTQHELQTGGTKSDHNNCSKIIETMFL